MIVVYKEMGVIVRYVLYGNRCPNVQDLQLSLKRNCKECVVSLIFMQISCCWAIAVVWE